MRGYGWSNGIGLLVLALALTVTGIWVAMAHWQTQVLQSLESGRVEAVPAQDRLPEQPDEPILSGPGTYTVLLERPLFTSTRRPPVEEEEPAPVVADAEPERPLPGLEDLELVSVLITPEQRQAWFRQQGSETLLRLATDDVHREWTLRRVEPAYVIFWARGSEYRVELRSLHPTVSGDRATGRAVPQGRLP